MPESYHAVDRHKTHLGLQMRLSTLWFLSYFSAIKNALKQEGLNPEVEEKLIKLQRYQERQMKDDTSPPPLTPTPVAHSAHVIQQPTVSSTTRKRPALPDFEPESPMKKKPSRVEVAKEPRFVPENFHVYKYGRWQDGQ